MIDKVFPAAMFWLSSMTFGLMLGLNRARLSARVTTIRDRLDVRRLARLVSRSRRAWNSTDAVWRFDRVWEIIVMMERNDFLPVPSIRSALFPRDVSHLRDRVLERWLELNWLDLTVAEMREHTELWAEEGPTE